jgi:hypothetical protein
MADEREIRASEAPAPVGSYSRGPVAGGFLDADFVTYVGR